MLRAAFHNHSGRVIGAGRVLLAGAFLFAVLLDQPRVGYGAPQAAIFLAWYGSLSAAHLLAIWNNWWLERRLGGPLHALDLILLASLFIDSDGQTDSFVALSIFLLLSATVRWGWREAALTTILVVVLYLLSSVATWSANGQRFSLPHFILVGGQLCVLSTIILWFGQNQSSARHIRALFITGKQPDVSPAEQILQNAATHLNAQRALLLWWGHEEPWINFSELREGRITHSRSRPAKTDYPLAADAPAGAFLFDLPRKRLLVEQGGSKKLLGRQQPFSNSFVKRFGIKHGLRVPLRSSVAEGELLLLELQSSAPDAVTTGTRLAGLISFLFERSATVLKSSEAAAAHERLVIARDLHDSVAQFLAGMSMQLEGVKKSISGNTEAVHEIESLQKELKHEQRDVRGLILALRDGKGCAQTSSLSQQLADLTDRLARQWGIKCAFTATPPSIEAPLDLRRSAELIVKEALANAVRHGGADTMSVSARMDEGTLELHIADNGRGFPFYGNFQDRELTERQIGPWSLHERVRESGGSLRLNSQPEGSRLHISLSMKGH